MNWPCMKEMRMEIEYFLFALGLKKVTNWFLFSFSFSALVQDMEYT